MAKANSLEQATKQLEEVLNEYLGEKAPGLPDNVREVLVMLAPWLAVLGVVMGIPAVLALIGLGSMLPALPFAYGARAGYFGATFAISTVFLAITLVLEVLAIPGLFSRSKQGWRMVFYVMLVGAVQSLIMLNLMSLIVGTLLGMYLLFQVRGYYK